MSMRPLPMPLSSVGGCARRCSTLEDVAEDAVSGPRLPSTTPATNCLASQVSKNFYAQLVPQLAASIPDSVSRSIENKSSLVDAA